MPPLSAVREFRQRRDEAQASGRKQGGPRTINQIGAKRSCPQTHTARQLPFRATADEILTALRLGESGQIAQPRLALLQPVSRPVI